MGLLSFFKRDAAAVAASQESTSAAVQAARTRARQRLIGALVLLSIGVVGFPLLFESQPRPIPVDIPISIPAKDGAPALTIPPPRPPASKVTAAAPAEPASEVITETRADAGRELPAPAAPVAASVPANGPAASRPVAKPAPAVVPATVAAPTPAPAPAAIAKAKPEQPLPASAPRAASPGGEAQRARALLNGQAIPKPASAAAAARFIVQIGAFADAAVAREARLKVEKLGLQTYTQVADTPGGKRIRVRVGPYAERSEADRAVGRLRAAGLPAALLTL